MTVNTVFNNWSLHQPEDDARYNRCSPNLVVLGNYLIRRWAMTDDGCYAERNIRAGELPSPHSHGAARDLRWDSPGRLVVLREIIPWLIENSLETHVQAIHDYFGCRIWRAGRTNDDPYSWWRGQAPSSLTGMGQSWAKWLHIETTEAGWGDSSLIPGRLKDPIPTPPIPNPTPPGAQQTVFTRTIKPGDSGPDVAFVQTVIRAPGSSSGNKSIVVDGKYGSQTQQAVKNIQEFTGNTPDAIIGPMTQAVFMQLANS